MSFRQPPPIQTFTQLKTIPDAQSDNLSELHTGTVMHIPLLVGPLDIDGIVVFEGCAQCHVQHFPELIGDGEIPVHIDIAENALLIRSKEGECGEDFETFNR